MLLELDEPPTAPHPRVRAGNRQVVGPDAAQGGGGVDQHAAGGNGGGKALGGVGILGVDGEGVARALPLQDFYAAAEHRLSLSST